MVSKKDKPIIYQRMKVWIEGIKIFLIGKYANKKTMVYLFKTRKTKVYLELYSHQNITQKIVKGMLWEEKRWHKIEMWRVGHSDLRYIIFTYINFFKK